MKIKGEGKIKIVVLNFIEQMIGLVSLIIEIRSRR